MPTASITDAPGYSPELAAFYRPADRTAYLADRMAASGCPVIRTDYGWRTMTPAEKAEWVAAQVKAA